MIDEQETPQGAEKDQDKKGQQNPFPPSTPAFPTPNPEPAIIGGDDPLRIDAIQEELDKLDTERTDDVTAQIVADAEQEATIEFNRETLHREIEEQTERLTTALRDAVRMHPDVTTKKFLLRNQYTGTWTDTKDGRRYKSKLKFRRGTDGEIIPLSYQLDISKGLSDTTEDREDDGKLRIEFEDAKMAQMRVDFTHADSRDIPGMPLDPRIPRKPGKLRDALYPDDHDITPNLSDGAFKGFITSPDISPHFDARYDIVTDNGLERGKGRHVYHNNSLLLDLQAEDPSIIFCTGEGTGNKEKKRFIFTPSEPDGGSFRGGIFDPAKRAVVSTTISRARFLEATTAVLDMIPTKTT